MLHYPRMEVTCDGKDCNRSVYLILEDRTGYRGGYDLTNHQAQTQLENDHSWTVEGDSYYCEGCRPHD